MSNLKFIQASYDQGYADCLANREPAYVSDVGSDEAGNYWEGWESCAADYADTTDADYDNSAY